MNRHLTLALCLVIAGCGGDATTPSAAASSTPQRAQHLQGPFRLVFELPRTTWKTCDAIEGIATLALVKGGGVDLGGSGGGLFGFDFAEVNGTRHVEPASAADCAPYRLDPGVPMTSAIKKSGGFSADGLDADFYRAFLTDPIVRLPIGDWRITAIASFVEGGDCSGASRTLTAPILVHVTP
jgi:hypothetical protein